MRYQRTPGCQPSKPSIRLTTLVKLIYLKDLKIGIDRYPDIKIPTLWILRFIRYGIMPVPPIRLLVAALRPSSWSRQAADNIINNADYQNHRTVRSKKRRRPDKCMLHKTATAKPHKTCVIISNPNRGMMPFELFHQAYLMHLTQQANF